MFQFTFLSIHLNEVIETIAVISTVATAVNAGHSYGLRNNKIDKTSALLSLAVTVATVAVVVVL